MDDRDGGWEPVASYIELSKCVYDFITTSAGGTLQGKNSSLSRDESWQYFNFTSNDVLLVTFLAVAFTVMRYLMTEWFFQPLAQHCNLTPANCTKMPESAWKFLFYFGAWSYTFYVVILCGRYRFFQSPSTVWTGWNLNEPLPLDIYWMYLIQCSFYVHATYATVFLDAWRKDSVAMVVHHILTVALLVISYSLRYYKIGSLTLLLHDICDIQMEFTKLNVYFRIQGGKHIYKHEVLANATFFSFVLTWILGRLYYYPLKLLYTATCDVLRLQLDLPYASLMNTMLWILQALNIYWFLFIVKLLVRVATGKMREVDDTREYDVDFAKQLDERPDENNHILLNGNMKSSRTAAVPVANGKDRGMSMRDRRKAKH